MRLLGSFNLAQSRAAGSVCRLLHRSSTPALSVLAARLFAPVDIASLVYFRIAFGAIMLWEVTRYFRYGWIERYFIDPTFYFTFYGFGWVRPWPGDGMYWHFFALGVLSVFIMAGFFYRISAVLFFLGFTYVFLLDQANYLNHFYLVSVISLLMVFVPAHRAFSVDVLRKPSMRSGTVPAWALWLLLAQISIVYFYAGVAKLNPDWLRGEPMRDWLANRTDFPVIGPLFTEEPVVWAFAYGGLLLDLLVAPLLLWRRTRWTAFGLATMFHLFNARLFSIGIFPWFMIAATLLFFSPSWPRQLIRRLTGERPETEVTRRLRGNQGNAEMLTRSQKVVLGVLGAYLAVQVLLPLRHWLYPGEVNWTEEGHHFSWHMKLRDKDAKARFVITDPVGGKSWEATPRDFLTRRQRDAMVTRPDMVLQFSHYLAEQYRQRGYPQVQVRALVMASLNGRPEQLLVDPQVDLASQRRMPFVPAPWIVPLSDGLID